jgi:hypothetical protein
MARIHRIEDPIMFLWACVIAYLLEFSLALVVLRAFYALRAYGFGGADPRRSAPRSRPSWSPRFELRAVGSL